eukprot:TRINITY_DN1801_c0_g1_i8.p1 TRINITY_DN1801_c0_g1~~TRINITY_DN1801_c0_g1_i8.p1  ORF type:complete len:313 (-),score=30.62 TRINITY_DN1801_c0_g1_i8:437-1375(-)
MRRESVASAAADHLGFGGVAQQINKLEKQPSTMPPRRESRDPRRQEHNTGGEWERRLEAFGRDIGDLRAAVERLAGERHQLTQHAEQDGVEQQPRQGQPQAALLVQANPAPSQTATAAPIPAATRRVLRGFDEKFSGAGEQQGEWNGFAETLGAVARSQGVDVDVGLLLQVTTKGPQQLILSNKDKSVPHILDQLANRYGEKQTPGALLSRLTAMEQREGEPATEFFTRWETRWQPVVAKNLLTLAEGAKMLASAFTDPDVRVVAVAAAQQGDPQKVYEAVRLMEETPKRPRYASLAVVASGQQRRHERESG